MKCVKSNGLFVMQTWLPLEENCYEQINFKYTFSSSINIPNEILLTINLSSSTGQAFDINLVNKCGSSR